MGNYTSASLYRIDPLRPSCSENAERLPVAASTASPSQVDCVVVVHSGKTLAPEQLSIMTRRGPPGRLSSLGHGVVLPASVCSLCPLQCVRIHASSFSGVARKKLIDMDCSTRWLSRISSSCGCHWPPFRRCQILLPFAAIRPHMPFLLAAEIIIFSVAVGFLAFAFALDGCRALACGDRGGGVALAFPLSLPLPLGVDPTCIGACCAVMYCCVGAISRIWSRVLIQLSDRVVLRMKCSLTRESCMPKMTAPILRS